MLISIRISDVLLREADKSADALNISRAEYLRRAIEQMNRKAELERRRNRLMEASQRVRKESMRVNAEMDAIASLDD